MEVPNCDYCGTRLAEITTKNGRKIFACPNWKPNGKGCQGTIYDPERKKIHKKIFPRVLIRWNVPSRSEPGKNRTVEIYEDGSTRCNCMAGQMTKFCHHQQVALRELEGLVAKIKKENKIGNKETAVET